MDHVIKRKIFLCSHKKQSCKCHIWLKQNISFLLDFLNINPTALTTAKTLWSFGRSECNRVKQNDLIKEDVILFTHMCNSLEEKSTCTYICSSQILVVGTWLDVQTDRLHTENCDRMNT